MMPAAVIPAALTTVARRRKIAVSSVLCSRIGTYQRHPCIESKIPAAVFPAALTTVARRRDTERAA
jgi:hypothetical protein